MSSFLCVKSIEAPINRYKCVLKCYDVVEGLLAGDVWEVLFVMAVPTFTSPTVVNPSWRNLCTTQYFPVNYIYLYIWACVCGQVRSSIPLRLFFFILSRAFFLSLAPFQELNNNNRAKSIPSHLVSAVLCLLQGVGSRHSGGVNSKDWSSLSLLHFQAQITWDVFRPAWLLARFLPELGNGNQENKCF